MISSGSLIWNNADPPAPGCLPGRRPLRAPRRTRGDTAGPSVEGGCEELPEFRPSRRFNSTILGLQLLDRTGLRLDQREEFLARRLLRPGHRT